MIYLFTILYDEDRYNELMKMNGKYVDISNFEFYENRISLFRDLPETGTIILNMKYINIIKQVLIIIH